ncbi:MAG: helix-turn-helix transcriptional regulator [Clostridiales bacterium]
MNFLERLDDLMAKKGINKSILANESDIPYTTIDAFYKKGYDNIKLSNLKKLSDYFGVTLDYLVRDEYIEIILSNVETSIIKDYRSLNEEGMEKVHEYVNDLVSTGRYKKRDSVCMDTQKQA